MRRAVLAAALAVAACAGEAPERPAGEAPPRPAGDPPAVRSAPADSADPWTAGIVERPGSAAGVTILEAVRSGGHEGFDRVTWVFSDGRPGLHVEYVDRPVRECGSGEPVAVAGDGWLEVRLSPAAAHDDAGRSTGVPRRQAPGLPAILEIVRTCDFEAVVTMVLGVRSPNPYRVLLLDDPPRIAIDVRR